MSTTSDQMVSIVTVQGTSTFRATSFVVDANGYLEVSDGHICCAIYVPGTWVSAYYTGKLAIRETADGGEEVTTPPKVTSAATGIEVYPVGLLRDLRNYRHERRGGQPRALRRALRQSLGYLRYWGRQGNWRAVKNYFNGYLAEPVPWPPEMTRCGTGWTQRRARRDAERRMP